MLFFRFGMQIRHPSLELSLKTKHQQSIASHENPLDTSWTLTIILQRSGRKTEDLGNTKAHYLIPKFKTTAIKETWHWYRYIKQLNIMKDPNY